MAIVMPNQAATILSPQRPCSMEKTRGEPPARTLLSLEKFADSGFALLILAFFQRALGTYHVSTRPHS